MTLPKISLIMPVLNSAKTLEKAILSVMEQAYPETELIIMDGGSTDGTLEIIKRYEHVITYWRSQYDGSAAVAVNAGIEKASGDLIALLMADDWYTPNTLHKIAEAYLLYPEADMVTCGGKIVALDETTKTYHTELMYDRASLLTLDFYNVCFAISVICCRFFKRDLFKRIGLFVTYDRNGKHLITNDKEFLLRAILHHAKDVFVNHIGHIYLAHHQSTTFGRNWRNTIKMCEEHLDMAQDFLKRKDLTRKQRLILHYWYNDQCARVVLYRLLERNFSAAWLALQMGARQYKLWWAPCFSFTVLKILFKKLYRFWIATGKRFAPSR